MLVSLGEARGAVLPKMDFAVMEGSAGEPCPPRHPHPHPFFLLFAVCDTWIPLVIDVTLTLWAPAVCLDVTM